jgi:hypothetical protein
MTQNADKKKPSINLDETVREARTQLDSQPLYIVPTKRGYTINEQPPQREPAYFRLNVDGSTTLIVHDPETRQFLEFAVHPASLPNMTRAEVALDEDTSGE